MPPVKFSTEELTKMKCQVMDQNIIPDTFDDSQLPNDIHIIQYTCGNAVFFDVVRAYTMVDIFDAYYQRVKEGNGVIQSIKSGFGRIKPKLYGKIQNKD